MTIKGLGCSAFLNEIEWNKKGVRSLSVCLEVGGSFLNISGSELQKGLGDFDGMAPVASWMNFG